MTIRKIGFLLSLVFLASFMASCSDPSKNKGGKDELGELVLKSMTVHGKTVENLKTTPTVEVENNIDKVEAKNIVAKFDIKKDKDKEIPVTVTGGEALQVGKNTIKLTIEAKDKEYKKWEKDIVVVRKGNGTAEAELKLSSLSIHTYSCKNIATTPTCDIPKDKTSIKATNVLAQFNYGELTNQTVENLQVLNGENLKEGKNTITLKVPAKSNVYKEWTCDVEVTLKDLEVELGVESIYIHKERVENGKVEFDYKHKTVIADDVTATFRLGPETTRVIPVEVRDCPAELTAGVETKIKLFVPALKDEYKEKTVEVTVKRKVLPPKADSKVTSFSFNSVETPIAQVKPTKVFESTVLKPVVVLATDRMFETVESNDFEVSFPDNRKQTVTLTCKENLTKDITKTVSIKVVTKTPNAEQEDNEKVLSFQIKLKNGTVTIDKIKSGDVEVTQENGLLKLNKKSVSIDAHITNTNGTALTAVLQEEGTTTKYDGVFNGTVFTFNSVAIEEAEKTFTVKVNGANVSEVTFSFKAKYEAPQTGKVVIQKVEVEGNVVENAGASEVFKMDDVEIKVYLAEEYEGANVTIAGTVATNPFTSNKKLFSCKVGSLVENTAKAIAIVASATGKETANFSFNLTYKNKLGERYITEIKAKSAKDDLGDDEGNEIPATTIGWDKDHFEGSVGKEDDDTVKLTLLTIAISDLKGKTGSNLKCEFSKDSEKAEGTFTEENGEWICDLSSKLNGTLKSFNGSKYVDFVVKIFDGTELIETRTVKIKGL